jgi:hypothetical protein
MDAKKMLTVASFEVVEAVRSRLLVVLVLLYGGGAALGSTIFLKILAAAEAAAKNALSEQMRIDPSQLPQDMVREQAMPWLAGLIEDEPTRQLFLEMDPLSIFFGFATLKSVSLLVLLMASASIASDVSTGAARFILFRCDRLAWTLGKTLGQAVLLAGCLLVAAIASALAGAVIEEQLSAGRVIWMLRTAFRTWIDGLAYLGIFTGISMLSRTPMRARAGAVFAWFSCAVAHGALMANFWGEGEPIAQALAWIFPGHHDVGLWSGHLSVYLRSVVMLLLIGVGAFALGYRLFERWDV